MVKHPPDVLITTPESLYLMLTSGARAIFEGTETVILDEIHAVAQTKRGAHLAITLERLVEQAGRDVQRVGLSATQNPLEEVGRFLVGPTRRVTVVDTGVRKPLDLKIHVPVESMVEPEQMDMELDPFAGQEATRKSIWPAMYPELLKLVREHRSTLIFVNNRRAAERLALRLNELADEPIARAHHGSLAREERLVVEELLKAGELPCLVATSSLELGHRHGRDRPRAPGRVAEVRHRGPPAHRPRRPQRRRHVEGPHLPQVPRRPARVRGGRPAHARGEDRDDRRPAQPARRAGAADRGDERLGRGRGAGGRPAGGDARPHLHVLRALPRAARERPRHARRPLPERGVRRAAAAHRVGPRGGDDPRPQGLPRAGDHERRHDPGPRPVLGQPPGRPPRRRARRGDGLRGPPRPGVPARRVVVADRGDHARPRGRHARPRRSRRRAVLEGRRPRPPA